MRADISANTIGALMVTGTLVVIGALVVGVVVVEMVYRLTSIYTVDK